MKIKSLLFYSIFLFAISCKKKENPVTPSQDNYLSTSSGSTRNYHQVDSSSSNPVNTTYTLTSTSRDSSVNGKTYHVFTNSTGNNQYLNVSGSDYYQLDSLPAGFGTGIFERLYLKDNAAVGTSWSQSLTVNLQGVPVPVTLTYSIAEKGITKIVNSKTYSDVIHVTATISSTLIPSASLVTNINSYYAKKYGLIESSTKINLNYLGFVENVNIRMDLVSANIL